METDDHPMATEVTAVIATEAKATAEVKAAMVAMVDRAMEALTMPDHLLQLLPLTRMLELPTTMLSMPSGPLTMLRTRLKTLTPHTVASLLSWPSTNRQVLPAQLALLVTVRTTVSKLMARHSLLHLVSALQFHRHLRLRITRDMERRRHHHLLPLRLPVVMVRYVHLILQHRNLTDINRSLHLPVCKSIKRL
jgi:hypothetical protein